MSKKYFSPHLVNFLTIFVLCLLLITSANAQIEIDEEGGALYSKYKTAKALPCGQRGEAVKIGKEILKRYGNDESNKAVIDFIRQDIPKIEAADKKCNEPDLPNEPYKKLNRIELIAQSKEILASEGNSVLALDVMLTLVSTGFDLTVVEKNDTYNKDTLDYAKLAIQRIEAGQQSKTGRWGVFQPFLTKENALGWMNYIIGWLYFNKLNQKKEGLNYFYQAVQYKGDNHKDLNAYSLIGDLYSDELYRFSVANDARNDEFKKKLTLIKAYADRALIAYAKAYEIEKDTARKNSLYKKLENLYKFRFNLRANEKPFGLNQFIPKLILQPLPKPTDQLDPLFEDPTEILIHKNRTQ